MSNERQKEAVPLGREQERGFNNAAERENASTDEQEPRSPQ
jgi:hypothetical protein